MSLFQTKEFWSNQCAENDEEFDQNSLFVAQLSANRDNIIIGSHNGTIRIYQPSIFIPGDTNNFRANDLLVERVLDSPILQIGAGKFVSGSQQIKLAVLHPRSIAVYSLVVTDGITEHGVQYFLNFTYEHQLRRTAVNFTYGPFGGALNRDFICVQSLDGLLTFCEQEMFNFCCFLPEFLLPGPLVYVRSADSFVTAGSTWQLRSYSYKNLSEAGDAMNQEDTSGRKVNSIWSYNLGEGVLDIQTMYDDITRQNFIAVLGERNMYCFNDGGKLRFMKKLEFMPMCFYFYFLNNGEPMFLIISDNNTMLVYQHTTVKWSAKLQFLPMAVSRLTYLHILGSLVLLSESGFLQICYLGTDPNIFSAPPLRNQELDFEAAEKELESLYKEIKCQGPFVNTNAENDLDISVSILPHIKEFVDESSKSQSQKYCQVTIEIFPKAVFDEVHISAFVQKPLIVSPRAHYYTNLTNTATATCYVHLENNVAIPSLNLDVSVSCISSLGVTRLYQESLPIPLNLVMETTGPIKESECKVTLNINENPVPLSEIFPEYIGENSFTMTSNAIGFKIVNANSPVVTILTAKTSQRYRIQCDDFSFLNVMVQEIIRRLEKYYSNKESFKITFTSSLPTAEIFKYMEAHFQSSQAINKLQIELKSLSNQLRLIQKRLVVKFKQKNPTPLSNLDLLLQDTFEDIMKVMTNIEEEKERLSDFQIQLSSALQLISTLVKLTDTVKDMNMIEAALCTFVYDIGDQNWEDVIDAGLCYLLRTSLSKSEKDKHRAAHTTFEEIKDINKLEKHFMQVLDRATRMETNPEKEATEESSKNLDKVESTNVEEVGEFGTEIGKSSSRILSARKSLLKRRNKVAL